MAKNDFQYGGWNSYTLQCGTIMTLISPGDCTLQCGMWLWNRDSEFTKWQHPAMWYVALGWHVIEFAQTSAILKFYIWFRFRPHHRSRHVILHQSPKFYPNRTTLDRNKRTSCRFSRWRISAILDFRDPTMGSLKSPGTTSYRSSIETIAPNCLVFEKIAAIWRQTYKQTNRQTDRWTNEQMDTPVAWSRSRCRERRLKHIRFLSRDAMHKRGICCHPVSVRLSVCTSRSWIAPKRLKISLKFFHHRVAKPF